MSEAVMEALIQEYAKSLRLPTFARNYREIARRASNDGWSFGEYLREVMEGEVRTRNENTAMRYLKQAQFHDIKTLDQIDWSALKGVSRQKIAELSSCEYIKEGQDVVIAGPIGTGKTHLAIALGVEAARKRIRVAFCKAAELVRDLAEARDERQLGRLHRKYQRIPLLILDELGFVPFKREGGELLFNLLADRYERRSTFVTTNLAFSEWVQVFGDEKLTTALLDRLAHHAHILTTKGCSFRTGNRRAK